MGGIIGGHGLFVMDSTASRDRDGALLHFPPDRQTDESISIADFFPPKI
jgi:hypothetical protein